MFVPFKAMKVNDNNGDGFFVQLFSPLQLMGG